MTITLLSCLFQILSCRWFDDTFVFIFKSRLNYNKLALHISLNYNNCNTPCSHIPLLKPILLLFPVNHYKTDIVNAQLYNISYCLSVVDVIRRRSNKTQISLADDALLVDYSLLIKYFDWFLWWMQVNTKRQSSAHLDVFLTEWKRLL